jgi:hypothetical protein
MSTRNERCSCGAYTCFCSHNNSAEDAYYAKQPKVGTPEFLDHQMDHVAFIIDELGRRPDYQQWYCDNDLGEKVSSGIWCYLADMSSLAKITTKIRFEQLGNGCGDCLDNMLIAVCDRLWDYLPEEGVVEFPDEDLVRAWVTEAPYAGRAFLNT